MTEQNKVYLSLGSNIEPRSQYLNKALELIEQEIGVVKKLSQIYETEPLGFTANQSFLNCVILVDTEYSANTVLNKIFDIEKTLGRKRQSHGYSSRTIDIDILYFNNEIINLTEIIIPHPRLHLRKFVLQPLVDIAPEYVNPARRVDNQTLLNNCNDKSEIHIFKTKLV